jgi:hypothetical protein
MRECATATTTTYRHDCRHHLSYLAWVLDFDLEGVADHVNRLVEVNRVSIEVVLDHADFLHDVSHNCDQRGSADAASKHHDVLVLLDALCGCAVGAIHLDLGVACSARRRETCKYTA